MERVDVNVCYTVARAPPRRSRSRTNRDHHI